MGSSIISAPLRLPHLNEPPGMRELGHRREFSLNTLWNWSVIIINNQLNPLGLPPLCSFTTACFSTSPDLDVQLHHLSFVWSQVPVCPAQCSALRIGTWSGLVSTWHGGGARKDVVTRWLGGTLCMQLPPTPTRIPLPLPWAPYRLSARRHTVRQKCSAELLLPPD